MSLKLNDGLDLDLELGYDRPQLDLNLRLNDMLDLNLGNNLVSL